MRLKKLQNKLSSLRLDAILVTEKVSYRYLTGFMGTRAYLLVTADEVILFTDFRYVKQAREQVLDEVTVVEISFSWIEEILLVLKEKTIICLGLEKEYVSYQLYSLFKDKWPEIELTPVEKSVANLRLIKEEEEVKAIVRSVELADKAFKYILPELRPGRVERDIALELEYFLRREGAEGISFDFIVASGQRGTMPHGVASDKKLQTGNLITLDFGCVLNGYCSDITRTVALGEISSRQKEIYALVLEAQLLGLTAVGPGKTGKEVDAVVRDYFSSKDLVKYFGHGLGHGVGLEVHESPRLSPDSEEELKPGMVVTVEPGLYIDDFGGVRIEDMVLVTSKGCRVLTKSSKELIKLSD